MLWGDRIRIACITALFTVLSIVYCLTKSDVWQASQGMILREPASADRSVRGKFLHSDDRKTVQAGIAAIANQRETVENALKAIGPPKGYWSPKKWPTASDTRAARGAIEVAPPNGSEYGKTEIFYLHGRDKDRARAAAFTSALGKEMQKQYQHIRDEQARDMTRELEVSVQAAQMQLHESTLALSGIETELGADLGELRMLESQSSSVSDLRQNLLALENEKRSAEREVRQHGALITILQSAKHDGSKLLATPTDLLNLQPALRRLKEGVVDAQIKTAQLLGKRTEDHPEVKAARETEAAANAQLKSELQTAIQGLEVDQQMASARVHSLDVQVADVKRRLTNIASLRARYSQYASLVKSDTEQLDRARRELAEVKSAAMATRPSNLLQLVSVPEISDDPVGPSSSTLCAGGLFFGLLCGSGLSLVLQGAHSSLVSAISEPARLKEPSHAGPRIVEAPNRPPVPSISPTASQHAAHASSVEFNGQSLVNVINPSPQDVQAPFVLHVSSAGFTVC